MVWLLQLQKNGQCMCSPLFFQSRTCHLLGPVHVGVYFAAVLWKLLGSGFSSGSPHWSPCHCCLCQWNRVGVWIWSCQVSRPPGVPAPAACTLRPIIQVSQSPQHWWCGYWLHCAILYLQFWLGMDMALSFFFWALNNLFAMFCWYSSLYSHFSLEERGHSTNRLCVRKPRQFHENMEEGTCMQ